VDEQNVVHLTPLDLVDIHHAYRRTGCRNVIDKSDAPTRGRDPRKHVSVMPVELARATLR
jgi:hypothetical protein